MRKLSLNPEQLRVQSFPTQEASTGRGTVAAHLGTVLNCQTDLCQTDPPACGTVMRLMSCASSCTQEPEICPAF